MPLVAPDSKLMLDPDRGTRCPIACSRIASHLVRCLAPVRDAQVGKKAEQTLGVVRLNAQFGVEHSLASPASRRHHINRRKPDDALIINAGPLRGCQ